MMFYVYILFAASFNRFYIGQTSDVSKRLQRHNSGNEKSTSAYAPWELIMSLEKTTRPEAMKLERKLKNLNTEDLQRFIEKYNSERA